MSNPKNIDKSYQFPDPPAPYELECFKIFVPKHSLYIGAFWQAYQFFTTWLAWANDPLKRGKQAAALWRTAFDKARALYEITKGQCDMNVTGIRFNPNDKCELQVQYDGGAWTSVGSITDCSGCSGGSGGMQFDGVNVSIYNSCTGEFEPTAEPYNPTTSQIFDSLYSADQSGQCNGAANIAAWLNNATTLANRNLAQGYNLGTSVSLILGLLASLAGGGIAFDLIIAGLAAYSDLLSDTYDDIADENITEEMKNLLYKYTSDDGTIRDPQFTEAYTEMFEIRDSLPDMSPERLRWGFEALLFQILGPSVMSRQNKFAGITDADCTGANWTEVFDFTTSRHGWVLSANEVGVYLLGTGWTDGLHTGEFDTKSRGLAIKVALPSRTITQVKVYYDAILGINTSSDENEHRDIQWFRDVHSVGGLIDDDLTVEGENVYSWSGSVADVSTVIIAGTVGHDSVDPKTDPGGDLTVNKIVLSGTGTNPFV